MKRRRSNACAAALAAALVGLWGTGALAAASGCDGGKWPLSAVQTQFGGALPALSSGDALPALGSPVLVNLRLQSEVDLPHAPGRSGKAKPAYAAVVKLGSQPAATYQVTVSAGAWIDLVENGELVRQAGYVRAKDCAGVDKSIRFKTGGGELTLEITGAYDKTIKLEAARAQ